MKVIRCINNNVAVCVDSAGNEIVAFGRGIGFKTPPYEYDIKNITRTFYHVDKRYLDLMSSIPDEISDIAMEIRDFAAKKGINTTSNLFFALVDHINFAIERQKKGIYFSLPIKDDIRYKFEDEMEIGTFGLKLIEEKLHILMPKDEACYIALNIINSETEATNRQERELKTINETVEIINKDMDIVIDESSVSYSRFSSHMHYLLRKTKFNEENNFGDLLNTMIENDNKAYQCALHIANHLEELGYGVLCDDEILFLTLHVSRLCQRQS